MYEECVDCGSCEDDVYPRLDRYYELFEGREEFTVRCEECDAVNASVVETDYRNRR